MVHRRNGSGNQIFGLITFFIGSHWETDGDRFWCSEECPFLHTLEASSGFEKFRSGVRINTYDDKNLLSQKRAVKGNIPFLVYKPPLYSAIAITLAPYLCRHFAAWYPTL
jgi:hypothetical protein